MIQEFIEKINQNIASAFTCKEIEKKDLAIFKLAQTLVFQDDENTAIPLIICNNDEGRYVFTDDNYDFGCYHRILSKTYTDGKPIGDGKETIETADMILVAWGFSNQLDMNVFDVEEKIIVPAMPDGISLVSTEFDKYKVVNSEFRGFNYQPIPEEFVFSVRYKIVSKYIRKCKKIC